MRITGGYLKGLRIPATSKKVRPAMEKMRLALFSMLGTIETTRFLDLFSGSGIVGFEACSRGAATTLIERDPHIAAKIHKFIRDHQLQARLHTMPVESYVHREKHSFDTIYCDPPFPYRHKADLLERIANSSLMTKTSTLILHYPREEALTIKGLMLQKTRCYGRSVLSFYVVRIDGSTL